MRCVLGFLLAACMGCASAADPFEAHRQEAFLTNLNYAYLLELGDDALLARVHLVRNAQRSIDIQTFIWAPDESGIFMFYELWKAANRGVKVRVLIDDLSLRASAEMVPYLADLHDNLEIRQYNPLADNIDIGALQTIGEFTVNFGLANHRMHNKIVVVDEVYGITGGRNYQNDYFDRGVDRTFKDRDILVIGDVAADMRTSFEEYWNDEHAVRSRDMKDVKALIEADEVEAPVYLVDYQVPAIFDQLSNCADSAPCINDRIASRGVLIDEMIFVADHPGKHEDGDDIAETTESIIELMQWAKSRIVIQTPYLVAGSTGFFRDLIKENEDLDFIVSTNSLGAADHFYAYAFSYKNKKKYLRRFKWQIHEMKSTPPEYNQMVYPVEGVEHSSRHYTCIHSKTYLFDEDVVWLGSFNMDPRSARLNTEAGVILRDREFFNQVHANIMRDISPVNSWTIGPRRKIPILAFFNGLIENIFALIPIANIWPFTYSTSYELREGGEVMPFFDKRFHDNYRPVGQFPGVEMTPKAIQTRLTKAFFGPAEPII